MAENAASRGEKTRNYCIYHQKTPWDSETPWSDTFRHLTNLANDNCLSCPVFFLGFVLLAPQTKLPKVMKKGSWRGSIALHEDRALRGGWSNQLDFLFSCISLSVGLGNVWRFPYLCYENGGGAFLVTYSIAMCVCGIPIFFQEVAIGQYLGSGGSTVVGQLCPIFKGVGYATMTLVFFLNVYYCIIISWTLFYLISTFYSFPDLPWQYCDNYWNTKNCDSPYREGKLKKINATMSSVEEFWKYRVLGMTNGITEIGGIRWELLMCLILGWLMVYLIVCKGIHRSGKVIWFSALFPYIVLIILLGRALTLPGAGQGLFYFIYPQWEKLLHPKPWIDGATQIFFAYSIGTGALPTLGSFNHFHHNCYRDTVITCIVNTLTSLLAGCVTFSILGNLAHEHQLSVDKVVTSGPGLVFLTYPEVVIKLPGSSAWAAIFFMMLIVLGIDSEFCLVESFITGMVDNWPTQLRPHRGKFTFVICFVLFILGIPMVTRGGFYIFKLMDYYSASGISLLWVCIFQTIAISWLFGAKKVGDCIKEMLGNRPNKFLYICWVYSAPITMIAIFLFYMVQFTPLKSGDYVYPSWAQFIGICISMASMIWIPGYAIYYLIVTPGPLIQKLKEGTKAKALYEEDPAKKNSLPWSDSSAVLLKRSSYDENH